MNKEKLFGTRLFTKVPRTPSVYISSGQYIDGDIFDANSVMGVISQSVPSDLEQHLTQIDDNIDTIGSSVSTVLGDVAQIKKIFEDDEDEIINKWDEIVNFLADIEDTETLDAILDGIRSQINEKVASQQVKTIQVLSQAEYNALAIKDPNTEYNIIEA